MSSRASTGLRGYAICTAPRSGSNLLCQYLASTEELGRPLEYFNTGARRSLNDPSYPDDPREQIAQIMTAGSTPNRIYGLKLFQYQHLAVAPTVDWTRELPNLSYVYLHRRDDLGQALSWARAIKTSQYRSTQPVLGEPVYDADLIAQLRDSLDAERQQWAAFFADRGIAPLMIAYEDFVQDPQRAVDQVAQLLGVHQPPKIAHGRVDLVVQRDALSDEWRQRFISEQLDVPRCR